MNLIRNCALAGLLIPSLVLAEIAVIVHPSASFDTLEARDIKRIFLGKSRKFPNGQSAVPLNQDSGSDLQNKFNKKVCGKSEPQYRAYWSQLIFTGKGMPPKDRGGNIDVIEAVADNPNYIGYIDASAVDDSVKVVFSMP